MKIPQLPHGMGTITYRSDNRYEYRRTIKLKNGRSKRVSVYGETPKECMEKMAAKEKEIDTAEYNKATLDNSLAEELYEWLEDTKKLTLKPQSYQRLKGTIKNQIAPTTIGKLMIRQINYKDLQKLINKLVDDGYAFSSVKKVYDILNDFYRTYSAIKKIDNPMTLVTLPRRDRMIKEEKEISFFDEEDIELFTKTAVMRYGTGKMIYKNGYVLCANIYLGLRIGELLALRWEDIDFKKKSVRVNKTQIKIDNPEYNAKDPEGMKEKGITKELFVVQNSTKRSKNRYVPMNSKALEYMRLHKENSTFTNDNDFVVSTDTGGMNTNKYMAKAIEKIEQRAGTKQQSCNTHILRHTCASLYFRHGVPIETICAILGNSREVCETTYVHFVEEQLREASDKTLQAIEL